MKTATTLLPHGGKRKFFAFFAALLLTFTLIRPAGAGFWDVFTGSGDWQRSQLSNDNSPTAKKLITWFTVTESSKSIPAQELIRFVLENSTWPKLYAFRDRIENNADDLKPAEAAAWFDQNPPKTATGIKVYVSALNQLGRGDKARDALKKFWLEADLDKKETAALAEKYKNIFTPADHIARLDELLWDMRFNDAEAMMPLVDADYRKLAEARIALGRLSSKAAKLVKAVPASLQNDNGLLYSRLRYRREMSKDNDAFEIIRTAKTTHHAEDWWRERNILARRAIEKRNFSRAHQIILNHGMTSGADYSVAEWTIGWLELEYLNQPDKAYQHFDKFYQAVKAAVSRSRAAWWLARAAEKLHQPENAQNWYKVGAQFPSTFYGQLCYEKLNGTTVDTAAFPDDQVPPQDAEEFNGNSLVEAVHLLAKDGLNRYADVFLTKLLDIAKTRGDFVLIARLADEAGRRHYAVEANKQMQLKIGEFMFTEGYPLLKTSLPEAPESALIHAIVHRESMFNTEAASPAGARGLMQLMPGTAKHVARQIGKSYSADKLTESPSYNIELGAAYLSQLIENYDGFYPLAIAAYNAGPANVSQWVREFGDPRSKRVNLIDWIEEIPIYETRNYIQRVMESYYIYKLRLNEEPKTIYDFKK